MIKYGRLELHKSEEVIAVGDIHGEYKKLENILPKILPFLSNPKCHLVFCGDYCDIGENSPKVFEILIDLKNKYPEQVFFISGNHEAMLEHTLSGRNDWLHYTNKTLYQFIENYNLPDSLLETIKKVCDERGVTDFLKSLIPYYESDSVIITHAPLDKTICLMHGLEDYEEDLKDPNYFGVGGKYFLDRIIFELFWGNTPEEGEIMKIPQIKKFLICGHQFKHHPQPRLFKDRAFIDTGCGYYAQKPLIALKYPGKVVFKGEDWGLS